MCEAEGIAMNNTILSFAVLTAYIAFFTGAVVADPNHELVLHNWYTVVAFFTIPAVFGFLIGLGVKQ